MTGATGTVAWWAQAIALGGVVAVLLLPLGALGTRFGLWQFQFGFMLIGSAAVIALLLMFGGIVGLVATFRGGLGVERTLVLVGMVLSLGVLASLSFQFSQVARVPPIHDITTDPADPPEFRQLAALRGPDANPLEYRAEVAAQQREAYPWLQPMQVDLSPSESFARSRAVLEAMGLEIVHALPGEGRIEAVATSFWFGFKDDLVVRIRPRVGGTVIDLRSASRVGRSDLGVNARRIAEFQYRFLRG
jgi:uncharacterized protein (DUF1499 family)